MSRRKKIGRVQLIRYTYEAWKKLYPNAKRTQYDAVMGDKPTMQFVLESIAYLPKKQANIIRVNTLDDEYMQWVVDNNKTFDYESSMEYVECLTDAEASRLLKKHGWDNDYFLMGIPIFVLPTISADCKTAYELPGDLAKELSDYLEQIYGKGNVFASKYVMTMDDLYENPDPFYNIAMEYFANGTKISLQNFKEQHFAPKTTEYLLVLPFVIKWHYDLAVFDMKEIETGPRYLATMEFSKPWFEKYQVKGAVDFIETALYEDLLDYFEADVHTIFAFIARYCVSHNNIPMIKEDFRELMKTMLKGEFWVDAIDTFYQKNPDAAKPPK